MELLEFEKENNDKAISFFKTAIDAKFNTEFPEYSQNVKITLISFAIFLQHIDDYLYFDYPYHENVDLINNSLKETGKYNNLDVLIYNLLNTTLKNDKYLIYNYQNENEKLEISNNITSKLSEEETKKYRKELHDFFKIMYYSAHPTEFAPPFESVEINISSKNQLNKWFILYHNEDIDDNDSKNNVISNYCLEFSGPNIDTFIKNGAFLSLIEDLKTFSRYYASAKSNVVIKRQHEYLGEIISLNYFLFHHVKKLHQYFTILPLLRISEEYPNIQALKDVSENTERIQTFYNRYIDAFAATFSAKSKVNFGALLNDSPLVSRINSLKAEFLFDLEILNSNINILSIDQYLIMIFEELIFNGCREFVKQNVVVNERKIIIDTFEMTSKGKNYVLFTVFTEGTVCFAPMQNLAVRPIESLKLYGSTGTGLFVMNKLLRNLDSYCFNLREGIYFKFQDNYKNKEGFSVSFAIQKFY